MVKHLLKSKEVKNDEFYTRYCDIEAELQHYIKELKGKRLHCPCDDYKISNFYKYLKDNFHNLGLKELSCSGLGSKHVVFDGKTEVINDLISDGDFRSVECVDILKKYDVIITNPPFSLLIKFIELLVKNDKDFIILAPINSISVNIVLNNLISRRFKIRQCVNVTTFENTDKKNGTYWLNTFKSENRINKFTVSYKDMGYKVYDKMYNGEEVIEVSRTKYIPIDYYGLMGVPISALERINLDDFIIYKWIEPKINNKHVYKRILIRRKHV